MTTEKTGDENKSIQEPPGDSNNNISEDKDELYIRYLNALDDYYSSQKSLGSNISSAFIHLARANFNSAKSYGQIWYDERMKAKVKVNVNVKAQSGEREFCLVSAKDKEEEQNDEQNDEKKLLEGQKESIKMFGAFPPENLRKSQEQFIAALRDMIDVLNRLRILEQVEQSMKQMEYKKKAQAPIEG